MKACPQCGQSGTLTVQPVLVATPPSSAALPGAQLKIVAQQMWTLTCAACGLRLAGRLENATIDPQTGAFTGGHFIATRNAAEG